MNNRIINFSAGPAVLPESVLEEAQAQLLNYKGSGMSVMEMSHRSKVFEDIRDKAEEQVRKVLKIPSDYEVLFLQGGASLQFSMVPLNLCQNGHPVDVIHSGSWTKKAIAEIKKTSIVASSEEDGFLRLPGIDKLPLSPNASFVYMASNNTIFGTQFKAFPNTGDVPLVADMSSDILSREIDVRQFGLIFAGAQKNIGPSGLSLVIIRKDLAEHAKDDLPSMLQYRTHIKSRSLYNTPPTFGIYMAGLVFDWIQSRGGLAVVQQQNEVKAKVLYDAIDNIDFFYCPIEEKSRSNMNVVFRINGNHVDMENAFVKEAAEIGLVGLKGHRSVGGLRASIYNAQSLKNIKALIHFMETNAKRRGRGISITFLSIKNWAK